MASRPRRPDLKNVDVIEFLRDHSGRQAARHFGVSETTISAIRRGTRGDLTMPPAPQPYNRRYKKLTPKTDNRRWLCCKCGVNYTTPPNRCLCNSCKIVAETYDWENYSVASTR